MESCCPAGNEKKSLTYSGHKDNDYSSASRSKGCGTLRRDDTYTHKTKGAFEGARGAIQAYGSFTFMCVL